MKYFFSKVTDVSFDDAEEKVRSLLKEQGFGVLTEIDVQATLKKKIDVDFRKYKILGACNPPFSHKALLAEDKVGLMLPCNVILQQIDNGRIEIAAVDPVASMSAIENDRLKEVAGEIRTRLNWVVENL